jgi:hypothetical protein
LPCHALAAGRFHSSLRLATVSIAADIATRRSLQTRFSKRCRHDTIFVQNNEAEKRRAAFASGELPNDMENSF